MATPSTPPKKSWSWRSQAFRGIVYQVMAAAVIAAIRAPLKMMRT